MCVMYDNGEQFYYHTYGWKAKIYFNTWKLAKWIKESFINFAWYNTACNETTSIFLPECEVWFVVN